MISQKLLGRIWNTLYPLRPSNPARTRLTNARRLTQTSHLLLFPPSTRPQLPFLHSPSSRPVLPPLLRHPVRHHLSRLLSPERQKYLTNEFRLAGKLFVYGWSLVFLYKVFSFGVKQEIRERNTPTPPEWTFSSRVQYRDSRAFEDPDESPSGTVDWVNLGQRYEGLLDRLEHENFDGADVRLVSQDETNGRTEGGDGSGLDISAKSEPWRRAYHDVLMRVASAAQHIDGFVRDVTGSFTYSADVVIGPSNPRPRPMSFGAGPAPLEENCVPTFDKPDRYYDKLLTTRGFSPRQRLDAALAYADWLDFQGMSSRAEEVYKQGLDIILNALPTPAARKAVDPQTGIIIDSGGGASMSANVLLATSSLAIFYARHHNYAAAAPIFLSILRARRQLDSPPSQIDSERVSSRQRKETPFTVMMSYLKPHEYPPPPPSGDDPQFRDSTSICEEAAIMAHLGEILFASSTSPSPASTSTTAAATQKHRAGLAWTREAVDLAEDTLLAAHRSDDTAREKCKDCLNMAMENWSTMVQQLATQEHNARNPDSSSSFSSVSDDANSPRAPVPTQPAGRAFRVWSWLRGKTGTPIESEAEGRWEAEVKVVAERRDQVRTTLQEAGLPTDR